MPPCLERRLERCLRLLFFFFSSRRRHTRSLCDWSSDVCSSDLSGITLRHRSVGDKSSATYAIQHSISSARLICRRQTGASVLCRSFTFTVSLGRQIGRASCRERV